MQYDPSMSKILWDSLELHSMISLGFVQRKFKVNLQAAVHIIAEFNKHEVIPLRKLKDTSELRQNIFIENNDSSEVSLRKFCCKRDANTHIFTQKLQGENTPMPKNKRMIVVIGGVKGGVGKSTLAINLVTLLSMQGKRVLFVDADKIRSSSKFVQHRNNKKILTPWTTICLQNNQVSTEVLKLRSQFDQVVIDVGGGDSVSQRHAFGIADILIAPFKPSFPDIETLDELRELVTLAKPFNPKLKVFGVLNQADRRGRTNEQGKRFLQEEGFLTCLQSIITHRVSIRNSWSAGLGVVEMKPQDEKAVTEITNFYREIYEEST